MFQPTRPCYPHSLRCLFIYLYPTSFKSRSSLYLSEIFSVDILKGFSNNTNPSLAHLYFCKHFSRLTCNFQLVVQSLQSNLFSSTCLSLSHTHIFKVYNQTCLIPPLSHIQNLQSNLFHPTALSH